MCRSPLSLRTGLLLVCLAMASCAPTGGGGAASGDAATRAACRQAANRVYDAQNRAEIYAPASGVNSPASGAYSPGGDSRGLSSLFAHDRMIDDCVRRQGIAEPAGGQPAR